MNFEKNYFVASLHKRSIAWSLVETIGITILAIALMYYLRGDDILSLSGPIPWIALVPIMFSLFYGTFLGLLSLIILFAFVIYIGLDLSNIVIRESIFGISLFTLIVGMFSSYWITRIREVEDLNTYAHQHLDDLSREYYMLHISHDRLEHAYLTKPLSFRDAFLQIRKDIVQNGCALTPALAEKVLSIFNLYCPLNSAALCLMDKNLIQVIAKIGKDFPINPQDKLIVQAIKNQVTSYISANHATELQDTEYLAVLPMMNYDKELIGLIVIQDMPFWSLNQDNLEVLSIFASYFGLKLSTINRAETLLLKHPDAPPDFMMELINLVHLQQNYKIESYLAGIYVPNSSLQKNIVFGLKDLKLSLDSIWEEDLGDAKLVLFLIPFTSKMGIDGFKKRLIDWFKSEFGIELTQEGMFFRYTQLNQQAAEIQLDDFTKEFHHDSRIDNE